MLHPVFTHRYSAWFIIAFWFIHAIVAAAFLYFYSDLQWFAAVLDGAVYSFVLLAVGASLWYPIGYAKKGCHLSRKLLHNFLIVFVALVSWLLIAGVACEIILGSDQYYSDLAIRILPIRILWGVDEYMLIMVMYHFFNFYKDLEEKRLMEEVLKKQVKESELKILKAQLNPHFLFNSLNSVSALTLSHPEGARLMIAQLSDFLRYSLKNKHTDLISLNSEMENIRRYMNIEEVRFGKLLIYQEEVDATCGKLILPAMILQPIYENAIKHGLYESLTPVTVHTVAHYAREQDELHLTITNNYEKGSPTPRGAGLGLRHTENILRNLYNRDDLLTVVGSNDLFTVKLLIPQMHKK
jgi:sensor histidine kinase YesM